MEFKNEQPTQETTDSYLDFYKIIHYCTVKTAQFNNFTYRAIEIRVKQTIKPQIHDSFRILKRKPRKFPSKSFLVF